MARVCITRCIKNLRLDTLRNSFQRNMANASPLGDLKNNPHFEKYADKIKELQKSSPEEFLERIKALKNKNVKGKTGSRNFSAVSMPKETLENRDFLTTYKPKKLSDIMKTELIEEKSVDEVKQIWEEYHKTKDVIAAVIPVDTYSKINSRGKQYPVFLFPLPRGQGYEFIVSEISGHEVHFTPLISYQSEHFTSLTATFSAYIRAQSDRDNTPAPPAAPETIVSSAPASYIPRFRCFQEDKEERAEYLSLLSTHCKA